MAIDEEVVRAALLEVNKALASVKRDFSSLDDKIEKVRTETESRSATSARDSEAKLSRLEKRMNSQQDVIERHAKTIERLQDEILTLQSSASSKEARATTPQVKQEEEDMDIPMLERPNGFHRIPNGTSTHGPSMSDNGTPQTTPLPSASGAYHPYERIRPALSPSPPSPRSRAVPILHPSNSKVALPRAEADATSSALSPRIPSELKGKGKATDDDRPSKASGAVMERKKSLKNNGDIKEGRLHVNGNSMSRNGTHGPFPASEGSHKDEREKASLFASLHGSHVHSPSPSYPITAGSKYYQNGTAGTSKNLSTIDIAGLEEFASHLDTPAYFSTLTSPPLDSPRKAASKTGSIPESSTVVASKGNPAREPSKNPVEKTVQSEAKQSLVPERVSLSSIVSGAGADIFEESLRDRERRVRQREEAIIAREKELSALEESIAERLRVVKSKEHALQSEIQRIDTEAKQLRLEKEDLSLAKQDFVLDKEKFAKARKRTEAEHADKELELERRLALVQKRERYPRAPDEVKKAKSNGHVNGNGRDRSDSAESAGVRIDRRPPNEQEARDFRRRQDWETKKKELKEREDNLARAEEAYRQKSGDWQHGL